MGRYLLNDPGWRVLFAMVGTAAIVGVLFWIIVPEEPCKPRHPRIGRCHFGKPRGMFRRNVGDA